MKKLITLLLALTMALSLCACGSNTSTPTETKDETPAEAPQVETEPEEQDDTYKLGDAIETAQFKIYPKFTGYAYDLRNTQDECYLTPDGKNHGSNNPYNAPDGKTNIYGEMDVEYLGTEKSNVTFSVDISVDYDDGYVFDSHEVACCYSADGDWDDALTFEPLSSQTTGLVRYCIEVPTQVEENKDKPLIATIRVNGEEFKFDFRSADVLGSDYDPFADLYMPVDDETKNQITEYLKANGLNNLPGYYEKDLGTYDFTFGDSNVSALMKLLTNPDYGYEFEGTYEIFSGSILVTWSYGEVMHIFYTFDGNTFETTDLGWGRG